MADQPSREEQIFNTLLQFATREERAAYLKGACAGDAALLQRVQALLQTHEQAGASIDPDVTVKSTLSPGMPVAEPITEKAGDHINRYKLLQEIGEGGCGVVYMAEQEEPVRRRVALKIIKLGMDTKQIVARFEAERQALALMDHSNIAKVFDAGTTETGRPFFVMELVRGVPITEYCDKNNLTTHERLELFILICKAIQHAHQKGIIHRDIKPSNILVTLHDGVPVPKVIDFGIAKAIEQPLTEKTLFTRFEQFIGTPAYMSPEQAEMSGLDIDTRSDIYALGVLLYELLTGKPPFDPDTLVKSGLDAMRRTIREVDPPRPSTRLTTLTDPDLTTVARQRRIEPAKLSALVRGDLDWIVMKAMEKDRTRRYDTANSLAMDIQRHLQNEPVAARPPSNLYRFQKLVRRNKLVFAAASSVTAALIIGLGLSTWLFVKEREAHRHTQAAEREQDRMRQMAQQAQADEAQLRRQAKTQELVARQKTYGSDMLLVQQALAADNLGRARELLDSHRPRPGEEDLRGWEWRYLWQFCKDDALLLCQRSNSVITSVSFSSDGALLAVGTRTGEVTVWDLAARQLVFRLQSADDPSKLAFALNTDLLAYCDQTNVVLWSSRTRREVHRLQTSGNVRELVFTTDGRLFTACPGVTTLWDVESGGVVSNFMGPPAYRPLGTLFNATSDGHTFAHAAGLHGVRVVDTADGSNEWRLKATEETVGAIAFSRDGRLLATGTAHAVGTIKLWNVQSHQLVGTLEGQRNWICWLRFLPDGKTLASAGAEGTVRLWNLDTRQPLRTLSGHPGQASAIDVSPDGRWLARGCQDGSVFLWGLDSSTNRPPVYCTLLSDEIKQWSYSPDNRLIGTLQNGRVKLYDATTLHLALAPALLPTNFTAFTFSPDTRLLAAMATDGKLCVWDLPGPTFADKLCRTPD